MSWNVRRSNEWCPQKSRNDRQQGHSKEARALCALPSVFKSLRQKLLRQPQASGVQYCVGRRMSFFNQSGCFWNLNSKYVHKHIHTYTHSFHCAQCLGQSVPGAREKICGSPTSDFLGLPQDPGSVLEDLFSDPEDSKRQPRTESNPWDWFYQCSNPIRTVNMKRIGKLLHR